MTLNLGMVRPGSTILIPFHTFDSNDPSASVIISAFVLGDIGIYKGTSTTERASTTGVVLLDTDGIDIDGATGIHGFSIDLSSNATAGFYAAGSHYYVTVGPITIDAATVNFVAATFSIGYPDAILNTTINVFTSTDNFTLNEGSADDDAYNGCILVAHDVASAIQVQIGVVEDYTGSTKTINLKADPGVFTMTAADHISIMPPALLPTVAGTTLDVTTTGAAGIDWGNVENPTTALDLSGTDIQLCDTVTTNTDVRGTDNAATATNLATLTDALVLTSATIETVTSQTAFVIPATDDATDDGAYHGATAVFIDGTDSNQKSIRLVTDYTASSRTIEVQSAPDFTITTSDTITILTCAYTEGIWDQILTGSTHNIATSAGRRLRQVEQAFTLASGTIATVTNGHTFTLDAGAVATAEFYEHARLQIIEGTGAGQARVIVGYTSGRVVTLDSDFITNPDTSSLYEIVAADVHTSISTTDLAEGFVATFTNTTTITLDSAAVATTDYYKDRRIIFTHGTGAGQSREITAYTSGRVCTLAPALVTDIDTTTVWHIVDSVDVVDLVDDIWNRDATSNQTAGSFGEALGDPAATGESIRQLVGEFDAAAAAGDPSTAESIMQYVKQLVNVLVGSDGIATFPAEAAPANAVSLAEVIRAIHVDTSTTLDGRIPSALVSGRMSSDVVSVGGSTTAADKLEEGAEALAIGTVNDAGASTTVFVITLIGDTVDATDDHYNGRIITFTSGILLQQSTDITDYNGTTKAVTVTALTEAPGNTDQFVIS